VKVAFSLLFGLTLFMRIAGAGDAAPGYAQSYAILIKGSAAGSETVSEKIDDSGNILSTSEHEIFVTDGLETKRMAFSTKMILSKTAWTPISYTCKYTSGNSGDSYGVVIKDAQITRTLQRGGRTSESTVPFKPDMVILDFSVYHQYDYLIRRYDDKKGGRQLFADFVPIIGSDIPLALTFVGNEKLTHKKRALPVRNFRIEFVGIWSGTVSVDNDGRLVRLLIPAQDLEVVRKDLLISNNAPN
jgi:hypothetical protein